MVNSIINSIIRNGVIGSGGGGFDNPNLRLACGVLRPDGAAGAGASITWSWLITGGHDYDFFNAPVTINNGNIVISFPTITKLHAFNIRPDETLSASLFFQGQHNVVGGNSLEISAYQSLGCYAGHIVGNGTNWDLFGDLSEFTIGTNTVDTLTFTPPKPFGNTGDVSQNADYWGAAMSNYVGTGTSKVKKMFSGLGNDAFGYNFTDALGVNLLTNSSSDIIQIYTNTPVIKKINLSPNEASGYPGANIFTTSTNFWVYALLEI
jgi:hypothetical protein